MASLPAAQFGGGFEVAIWPCNSCTSGHQFNSFKIFLWVCIFFHKSATNCTVIDEFSSPTKLFFHISVTASFPVAPPTDDGSHDFLLLFLIFFQDFCESVPMKLLPLCRLMLFPELLTGSQCILNSFQLSSILSNRGPLLVDDCPSGISTYVGHLMLFSHILVPTRDVVFVQCRLCVLLGVASTAAILSSTNI